MDDSDFEFLIRVNYDSGNSEEFWVKSFSVESDGYGGDKYAWTPANEEGPAPIKIGTRNVESVWQLKARRAIKD